MRTKTWMVGLTLWLACGPLQAQDDPPAKEAEAAPAPPAATQEKAPPEPEVKLDDFDKGVIDPGLWNTAMGVSDENVSDTHVTLNHAFSDDQTKAMTQLAYHMGDARELTIEVKFDDFVANPNCCMQMALGAAGPNMVVLGRWSAGKQFIQGLAIHDGKMIIQKEIPYEGSSGVLKIHVDGATGKINMYTKEKPDEEYKEMPVGTIEHPAFKGPYFVALISQNWLGGGGPASVKLDWVKISLVPPPEEKREENWWKD